MPRRKALGVFAAGVVSVAVPGITPRRAGAVGRAVDPPCSRGGTFCGYPDGGGYNIGCCMGPGGNTTNTVCCPGQSGVIGSVCCPTGFTCGNTSKDALQNCICHGVVDPRTGECNCPPSKICGNTCCEEHEKCEDGECVPCPDDDRCGSRGCCSNGTTCQNKSTGLCCVHTWNPCGKGRPGGVKKCCPPLDSCCFNAKTNSVKCCGPGVECEDGRCKCTKDETRCGEDCCKGHEVCSKGKCCPKGTINCNGKCCKSHLCVLSAGQKVCCPIDRIGTPNGVPVCCPPGTKLQSDDTCCAPGSPDCCDSGELSTICGRGRICVNGKCH